MAESNIIHLFHTGYADTYPEADVVIGPIANDTIYDTLGILTSSVQTREQSLELLRIGTAFEQIVVKTEQAAAQLQWLADRTLAQGETACFRERLQQEEAVYQTLLAEALENML